jgi:hyperosmotically inducible periplasmic protein
VNTAETEVIAKNGTIILRGKAASTAQKDLTTEYAKDVEGVKKVKNEMTVAIGKIGQKVDNTTSKLIDDASVTALVKATLLYHRSTSSLGFTVETKDGVVKLEGKAANWDEKNLATKLVIDVPGVKMVFNNMTITKYSL